ncbi:MAG: hemerythrin domain-containing protein [Nanoarchaeota archaeon]
MLGIGAIRREHIQIKSVLSDLGSIIGNASKFNSFIFLFKEFGRMWKEHEEKEEVVFQALTKKVKGEFPEKMLLEQHRELKGHWLVLKKFMGDPRSFAIALDTDGRMLIEKFKIHINYEEELFNEMR